jgi:hypothetical protein
MTQAELPASFGSRKYTQNRDFACSFYGCETWSVTLKKEHRSTVFENRVLRGIFGPKRDEVTGGRRKLPNEGFRNWYSLPLSGLSNQGGWVVCKAFSTREKF